MRRWIDIINEAPISIDTTHMDRGFADHEQTFRPDDKKLMTSPKGVRKVEKLWHNSVVDVRLVLVDSGVGKGQALVTPLSRGYLDGEDMTGKLKRQLGVDIEPMPGVLTVVLTSNEGSGRHPLTAWTIAHRIFHCFDEGYGFDKFSESGFYNLSYSHLYSPLTGLIRCIETTDNEKLDRDRYSTDDELGTAIACALGRSRACRENNLNNTFELIPEMFAQYMLTGKITLNTAPTHFTFNGVEHTILWDQEPERFRYGVMTDKAKFTEMVNDFIKRAEDLFASWLDWSKGQIVAL
jgi:hypothetical protein